MPSGDFRGSSHEVKFAEGFRWHACYTRGKHENKVASHLGSRRIETFLPVHRLDVQYSDRLKTVDRPLFPSYVFARFQLSELPQVLNTRGLVTILRTGSRLAAIPDEEIENLRRFAGVLAERRIAPEREPVIEPGDRVRVVTGPFAGIDGEAVLRRGRKRLLVSLNLVGEGLVVDLDGASLQVLRPGSSPARAAAPLASGEARARPGQPQDDVSAIRL